MKHLHDARIVEQTSNREMKRDDLRSRAMDACGFSQVANNRQRVLALLLK